MALKNDNAEEIQLLRENPNTWGCYSVLNVLYSLIQRSQINEQLAAMKRGATEEAKRMLTGLTTNPATPQGVRDRAGKVLAEIGG